MARILDNHVGTRGRNSEVRSNGSGEPLLVDCRNLLCPMPIIKLSQAINLIDVGATLELLATDPGSQHDVEAWARQTGHEFVDHRSEGKVFTYTIRRKH